MTQTLPSSTTLHLFKPCFCFSPEIVLDLFFTRPQRRGLEDEIFSMAQKQLCENLHKEDQPAELSQSGLVNVPVALP